jgi:NADH dehydrogenase [ubiquinone] 1 alpha subcomplex assembly factor 1
MQNRNISGKDTQHPLLVSFHSEASQLTWQPLGDRVMGGQSDGTVDLAEGGVGVFHGTVRLDNGGGFASVKADLPKPFDAADYTGIELLARGDSKTYKIGLRNSTDRRSIVYQHAFAPDTENWSRIRLPFSDFIPTWRGRTVSDAEPLNTGHLASASLFVSGRQAGEFELRMRDWILY